MSLMKGHWKFLSLSHFLKSKWTSEFLLESLLGSTENFSIFPLYLFKQQICNKNKNLKLRIEIEQKAKKKEEKKKN